MNTNNNNSISCTLVLLGGIVYVQSNSSLNLNVYIHFLKNGQDVYRDLYLRKSVKVLCSTIHINVTVCL